MITIKKMDNMTTFVRNGEVIGSKVENEPLVLYKTAFEETFIPLNKKRYHRLLRAMSDERVYKLYTSYTFTARGEDRYIIFPNELLNR